MSAFRFAPQAPDATHRTEHYACAPDCLPAPAKRVGLKLDPAKQAKRLCVLPGFDCSTHPAAPVIRPVWMGRSRDYSREGKGDWAAPNEPIAEMGCPGAWYRTPFLRSLDRYYRRRTENGGRVDNPALTQCTDPLVIDAIQTLEAYEDAAKAEEQRRRYAEQAAAAARKAGRP